jgi:hypothetical protein
MMQFKLSKPCDSCPFLKDKAFGLTPRRCVEIATALRRGETFSCHKTVDYAAEEVGEGPHIPSENEQHCAGATIVMLKEERPGQLMRVALRLGMLDHVDMDAPVYPSLRHFERGACRVLARDEKLRNRRSHANG